MNDSNWDQSDAASEFDRLIDGELPDDERRQLLQRLERQPDGWRRLALGFLEAQCWRETAGSFSPRENDNAGNAPARPLSLLKRKRSSIGTPLAMAASFLLAFTLGLALRGAWRSANEAPTLASADRSAPAASHDALAGADLPAYASTCLNEHDSSNEHDNGWNDWSSASLDEVDEYWLPPELETSDASALSGSPSPALPQHVVRHLQRLGREVQTERSFWPVTLDDGRRALVPVDRVDIRFVGNDYQ